MIRYRFAEYDDNLVDAFSLKEENSPRGRIYSCIECKKIMIARFRGSKQRPHFAHKADVDGGCSSESYLHRLAKLKFIETFNQCKEEGHPFIAELPRPVTCSKYEWFMGGSCNLPDRVYDVDLGSYYDTAREEAFIKGFRADVLLESKNSKPPPILVEIAVTHKCDQNKLDNAGRIIELDIKEESDVVQFSTERRLRAPLCRFINFKVKVTEAEGHECLCDGKQGMLFCVYNSGKSILVKGDFKKLRTLVTNVSQTTKWLRFDMCGDAAVESEYFYESVFIAQQKDVGIKNCFLCKHIGDKETDHGSKTVFCKRNNDSVRTNDAAECEAYSLADPKA